MLVYTNSIILINFNETYPQRDVGHQKSPIPIAASNFQCTALL